MKVEASSESMDQISDTSVEDARWLLGAVCLIGALVLAAGLVAAAIAP